MSYRKLQASMLAFGVTVVFSWGSSAPGADEPAKPVSGQQPRSEKLEPRVGPVRSIGGLIGKPVKDAQGATLGKIESIGLDIGKGKVTMFVVQPAKSSAGQKGPRSIPPEALAWSGKDGEATVSGTLPAAPPQTPKDPDAVSQVLQLAAAPQIPVVDKRQEKLGEIVDFALARQPGEIAYAVFKLHDEAKSAARRYPIPLAAFVVREGTNDWMLELPEGILENTPAFEDQAWPETVSRAWTEYVRVRYGRPPVAGVRRETAAAGKTKQ